MAIYGYQITRAFTSGCDFRNYQYTMVAAGSVAGEVTGILAVNASTIGVLQNDPNVGEEATVCLYGLTKIYTDCENSSSPLTYGGLVKTASGGRAMGTVITATGSINIAGIALEAVASGSGRCIEMFYTGTHLS